MTFLLSILTPDRTNDVVITLSRALNCARQIILIEQRRQHSKEERGINEVITFAFFRLLTQPAESCPYGLQSF